MTDNMNNMPKVSVIVPVYNAEKSIRGCIDSILGQAYKNIELILVNDGSKDGSLEICNSYKTKDSERVIVIDQLNSGPAAARNNGISQSTGKYLAFVDSDDTVASDMLEKMVSRAEENSAEMVICGYRLEKKGVVSDISYHWEEGLYINEKAEKIALDLIDRTDLTDIPPYSWVRLVLKSVLTENDLKFTDGLIRSEDFHFWVKVQFHVKRLYLLSKSQFYNYMENAASITHTHVDGYWNDVMFIYRDLLENLPKQAEVKRRLGIMFIRRSFIALNNAVYSDNAEQAKKEINTVINEPVLINVMKELSYADTKRYKMYPILMKLGLKKLIEVKYMMRNKKRRSK